MSAPPETEPSRAPQALEGATDPTVDDPDGVVDSASELCPYLIAAEGDWRSRLASRDHRCTAVAPPAVVAVDKQRRLCLVAAHAGCATYLAARDATLADGGASAGRPSRWPVARTAPVLVAGGGGILGGLRLDRSLAQAGLVVLMVGAFAVLALARLDAGGGSPAPSASPAASAVIVASPSTGAPSASPLPASPGTSPQPSTAPATPSATPVPTQTTYRVRPGDTLSSIAVKFATTTKAIQQLNGIKNPSLIRVGQLLKIPAS
jgi:LysM repeat protein